MDMLTVWSWLRYRQVAFGRSPEQGADTKST